MTHTIHPFPASWDGEYSGSNDSEEPTMSRAYWPEKNWAIRAPLMSECA